MIDPFTVTAVAGTALIGAGAAWHLRRRTRQVEAETATLRAELQSARHAANHDPLTGLPNRRAFFRQATGLLADPARPHPVVAVVVDLDDFKRVNDERGHAAGDQVLATIAHRFAAHARDGLVARLGGDELVGLLPLPAAPDRPGRLTATEFGARLTARLAAPMQVAGVPVRVTVSVGVAPVSAGTPLSEALAAADAIMYRAKPRNSSAMATLGSDPADPLRAYRSDSWRARMAESR